MQKIQLLRKLIFCLSFILLNGHRKCSREYKVNVEVLTVQNIKEWGIRMIMRKSLQMQILFWVIWQSFEAGRRENFSKIGINITSLHHSCVFLFRHKLSYDWFFPTSPSTELMKFINLFLFLKCHGWWSATWCDINFLFSLTSPNFEWVSITSSNLIFSIL
jgi:hypothetical protein